MPGYEASLTSLMPGYEASLTSLMPGYEASLTSLMPGYEASLVYVHLEVKLTTLKPSMGGGGQG